jgi:glutamyl-tRNA synthetase
MLVDHGKAYRCFCTPKRLNDLGQWQVKNGKPVQYDRKCAHLSAEESADRASKGESHTIRLDIQESRPYDDLIFGKVKSKNTGGFSDTANAIILKSNGGATYHLANVVDDHLMKITHVIRGTVSMPPRL